jgi:site-specific DNA-methyltransferase (adenine-specific)
VKLIQDDCIEAMRQMPDCSVDSIVTDPPYELGFMGKSWDSSGIAFRVEVWQEALRILKPGGHLLAFSGSRTYHRMAVAIEDAGFEIRDQIMWVYGSGFPKSLNIAKALDKIQGVEPTVIGERMAQGSARKIKGTNAAANKIPNSGSLEYDETVIYQTTATSDIAKQWQGWGTALKPAHEPIVMARKPLESTVAENVLKYGTGGINIDATRVGSEVLQEHTSGHIPNDRGEWGLKEGFIMPERVGRFPANFIHDGSDEVVELFPDTAPSKAAARGGTNPNPMDWGNERLDGNLIKGHNDLGGSAARFFYCAKASKRDRNEGLDGFEKAQQDPSRKEGNPGGDNPRNRGVNKVANHHPTVKPTDLMQYLVRLVTPPNGTVLDPFMGSGSTGKACVYEGFEFIGIEQSAEYLEIARARIEFAIQKTQSGLW